MHPRPAASAAPVRIRPIDRLKGLEVDLVARRMRATLIEVLGARRGGSLYPVEWLRQRVRWHLDPSSCEGEVLIAELGDGTIAGHSIVRMEPDAWDRPLGLFATTYVTPAFRGRGVARALLDAGERWLTRCGARTFATDTDQSNTPLIRLFEGRGYRITHRSSGAQMVRLSRTAGGGPAAPR